MPINAPGVSPYIADDTRNWVNTYRVGNKVKPAFVLRAATDANYINGQNIVLPAYGNSAVASSICNIISPGQRLTGCLQWSSTEDIGSITQTAQLTLLDALPVSRISTAITGFAVGTGPSTQVNNGGTTAITDMVGLPLAYGSSDSFGMPQQYHSTTIRYQWVQQGGGMGIASQLTGNRTIGSFTDPSLNVKYDEANLLYRIFEPEIIQVSSLAQFPDPAVPNTESEGSNEWWNVDTTGSLKGVGAYYVLVGGTEVMRVTRIDRANNYLFVIPGGRGIAGAITTHGTGETVTLLGFPPFTSEWTGFGYLMPRDYSVTQSPLRPGNCFVSYEGYGNPGDYGGILGARGLSKTFNRFNNMCFTGYWFTTQPQATLDNTGVPQVQISFQSAAHVLTEQQINPDTLSRGVFGSDSWLTATFDQVGYTRKISGSWVDYAAWVSTLPGAYPLTISTQYAQNKAFFDHMADTDMGKTCQYCRQEWLDYVTNHEKGQPTGTIAEARAVGKHIYQESIQVFNNGGSFNAGPLKTYGRLMHALACASWENPLKANALGSRWSKIPNQLFSNLQNFINGRCWNGQLVYSLTYSSTTGYDWSKQSETDNVFSNPVVFGNRRPLKCPFTAQYDRQPWSQPMQDLSDINRMQYLISREGYPIFIPLGKKLRGVPSPLLAGAPGYTGPQTPYFTFKDPQTAADTADTDTGQGEWHLSYGGAIDSYTHTIDPSSVSTLVYVSCQTAFGDEITFTIPAAGTYIKVIDDVKQNTTEKLELCSNAIGNREGLQLTGGTQQTDAVSLDNLMLGLDWNTNPASWGLTLQRGPDNLTQVDAQPPVVFPGNYDISFESAAAMNPDDTFTDKVTKVQKFINFMMERRYTGPAVYDDNGQVFYPLQINESGKFTGTDGKTTRSGIQNIQRFLAGPNQGLNFTSINNGANYRYSTGNGTYTDSYGQWGKATWGAAKLWLQVNAEAIKVDVWWYVQNGLPWDQYVGAIAGLPIPQIRDSQDPSKWIIDQNQLAQDAQNWMQQFFYDGINYGNSIVDDSVNKATQKIINSNLADPRIQLGDVIWANVPGYMSYSNVFGFSRPPFLNGVYVTGITRTMDLQQGSYQATYQGYRYRGNYESNVTQNPNNYCSAINEI